MRLYDAHNHLQDERFGGQQAALVSTCRQAGVVRMVVNGSCEEDWPQVLALARNHPEVLPSFGYHPWYVAEQTPHWQQTLQAFLDGVPSAVGEIGLDRWKPGLAYAGQEAAFLWQLELAAARELPATIHCLRAWGRLMELLQRHPRPRRGFLLHSYGGPEEMVLPLARLGAYFGFPGYYLHPQKERQRRAFRTVPPDRLLIETDAPDQPLPASLNRYPLSGPPLFLSDLLTAHEPLPLTRPSGTLSPTGGEGRGEGAPRFMERQSARAEPNHPANLAAVYVYVAEMLGESVDRLAARVEENFARLFSPAAADAGADHGPPGTR